MKSISDHKKSINQKAKAVKLRRQSLHIVGGVAYSNHGNQEAIVSRGNQEKIASLSVKSREVKALLNSFMAWHDLVQDKCFIRSMYDMGDDDMTSATSTILQSFVEDDHISCARLFRCLRIEAGKSNMAHSICLESFDTMMSESQARLFEIVLINTISSTIAHALLIAQGQDRLGRQIYDIATQASHRSIPYILRWLPDVGKQIAVIKPSAGIKACRQVTCSYGLASKIEILLTVESGSTGSLTYADLRHALLDKILSATCSKIPLLTRSLRRCLNMDMDIDMDAV